MSNTLKLLTILADGHFHSGASIGAALGISRSAVWKQINTLKDKGVECYSVPGKGYRLATPLELLGSEQITSRMDTDSLDLLSALEIYQDIPSTNRYLMARAGAVRSGHACFAERQSAGRGRRGRPWVSPFGRNIYLSLYWEYALSPSDLSGLALAVGVGVVEALQALGVNDAQLKWPNDVLWQRRKLAGILLEMSGESAGPYHVVVGVGLNVDMCRRQSQQIDQPWADLRSASGGDVSRNTVAALLLGSLLKVLDRYEHEGFSAFQSAWQGLDAFAGETVVLQMPNGCLTGQACGVDQSGALMLKTAQGVQHFHSGEVSLRPREALG
ncbi:MAG TPA: bifunctional biotin--[acetyl-CoA-carboxylase] ligase/biotin operon repressor BirA [Candidatus Tenderia sp.]|nr:bifunctional biotin--[acetyl-CoA-carboxylase] ligase/biotin operon repressor BirA [Candidatus Tenderia sp.]